MSRVSSLLLRAWAGERMGHGPSQSAVMQLRVETVASLQKNFKPPPRVGWIYAEKKGPKNGATTLLKQHSFLLDNGPLKVLMGG